MMKKSIFTVAVASVLTLGAAQAETILYGSIRYDYQNAKNEFVGLENTPEAPQELMLAVARSTQNAINSEAAGQIAIKRSGKRLSNLQDTGSRIGLKGSEDLGNNNAVIYNLEFGFDGMVADENDSIFTTRLAILGFTGDWGTFTAGRQNNPFKVTVVDDSIVDDFNGKNVISAGTHRALTAVLDARTPGETNDDKEFYKYETDYDRIGKVIAYTTPDFAGFQANAAIMMDEALYAGEVNNKEKNIDLWTINAKYAYDLGVNGTILTKAGYIQGKLADENKSKAWGLFLGYSQDAFAVSAAYASGNHKQFLGENAEKGPKAKSKGWDLGASFSFGANNFSTVRAAYGESQLKMDGNKDKVKSWAVGFEQKLSTRTRVWAEYGQEKTQYNHEAYNSAKAKDSVISIGMRHDF